jgi:Flp pilus assembly protein TadD
MGVGILVLLVAVGAYSYYRLHRETTEAEVVHIETLIAAGRNDEARALMVDAQTRSRDVDALRLRIGRAFLHQGQVGPATALLSRVGGSLIKEESLAIAEYFLVSGDPFSASRFFEAGIKAGLPRTPSLLDRYGQALSLSSNGEGAVAAFRECLALDASRVGARLNLAATLANMGRFDEARAEALAVLTIEPANEKALSLVAALRGQS